MTALVKNKSKGTVLLLSVSSAYVALAGLTSIDVSGRKVKTYESVTLDGPDTETNNPSGYIAAPTIKAAGFYDPVHATYTNIEALFTNLNASTSSFPVNVKLTYADAAPTSVIYPCTGVGLDTKVDPGKGVMADIEFTTSGNQS